MTATSLFGLQVVTSDLLPIYPTDSENARRIVRHGLSDVLEWLGEPVGPRPGEPTDALLIDNSLHVSAAFAGLLRDAPDEAVS